MMGASHPLTPLILLLTLNFSATVYGLPTARAFARLNCDPYNSIAKNFGHLHKVSVRGEDERTLEKIKSPTMPLVCKNKGGKSSSATGSINLVEGGRSVTVLHTLVDLYTCEPTAKLDECGLYDGEMVYSIKWLTDPVELCKKNYNQDTVIEAIFAGKALKRKAYKVLCKSQLGELAETDVSIRGAMAKNFPGITRKDYGKAIVEGKGKIYRVSPYENVVRYDADTGKGTSGGAAIIEKDGVEYLIGVHRGDRQSSNEVDEYGQAKVGDGLPADEKDNFGEAIIFPDDMKICNAKKP